MIITFDPAKDQINLKKHGYSLGLAEKLEWDTLWEREDNVLDYQETRYIGILYYGLTLMCIIYTEQGTVRRVISLRKATKTEVLLYAQA